MIAEPPSELGAVQLTVACPLPAEAETPVGLPGTPSEPTVITDRHWGDAAAISSVLLAILVDTRSGSMPKLVLLPKVREILVRPPVSRWQ